VPPAPAGVAVVAVAAAWLVAGAGAAVGAVGAVPQAPVGTSPPPSAPPRRPHPQAWPPPGTSCPCHPRCWPLAVRWPLCGQHAPWPPPAPPQGPGPPPAVQAALAVPQVPSRAGAGACSLGVPATAVAAGWWQVGPAVVVAVVLVGLKVEAEPQQAAPGPRVVPVVSVVPVPRVGAPVLQTAAVWGASARRAA
jgi:hypothetical protein